MPDVEYFRQQARRCRELLGIAADPEISEQLRKWAEEFDELAAESARRAKQEPHQP
jgi:hypothetical protein